MASEVGVEHGVGGIRVKQVGSGYGVVYQDDDTECDKCRHNDIAAVDVEVASLVAQIEAICEKYDLHVAKTYGDNVDDHVGPYRSAMVFEFFEEVIDDLEEEDYEAGFSWAYSCLHSTLVKECFGKLQGNIYKVLEEHAVVMPISTPNDEQVRGPLVFAMDTQDDEDEEHDFFPDIYDARFTLGPLHKQAGMPSETPAAGKMDGFDLALLMSSFSANKGCQ